MNLILVNFAKEKQAYTYFISHSICGALQIMKSTDGRSNWKYPTLIMLIGISSSSPSKQVEKANLTFMFIGMTNIPCRLSLPVSF